MLILRCRRSIPSALVAAALLLGCTATGRISGPQSEEAFNQEMAKAESALQDGQREEAVGLYEKIAKASPGREEPWTRIAHIRYAEHEYPHAVVAAAEALQRDGSDQKAKGIFTVSALRVARSALPGLRDDSELAAHVRTDAQLLAKMLRLTFGEQVLHPESVGGPAARRGTATVRRSRPTSSLEPVGTARAPAVPAISAPPAAGGEADPFGALR
ncbi:tetratricopeptide repeat protein [Paracidovorax citrulli]